MKHLLQLFLASALLLLSFTRVGATNEYAAPQNEALLKVIRDISERYNVHFTYDREIVENVEIREYEPDNYVNVEDALMNVLKDTKLKYVMLEMKYVIIYQDDAAGMKSLEQMVGVLQKIIEQKKEKRLVSSLERLQSSTNLNSIHLEKLRVVLNVSGTVTDQAGEPLIGVNIQVKGTNQGTATDFEGNFTLEDVNENAILVFSYIGYETREVEVSGRPNINVVMKEDSQTLDEVVVVGYGTQKRSNVTSSISSVDMEDLEKDLGSNVRLDNALKGRVPGVHLQEVSGQPGSAPYIRIRGVSTITSGNAPLWVIDGLPTTSSSVLSNLDFSNMASIDVLKGVAATSIYGSRGANGVIIVKTKSGQSGKTKFNVSFEHGFGKEEKRIDMLNGPENAAFIKRARDNAWIDAGGSINDPMDVRPFTMQYDERWNDSNYKIPNYDYQDLTFRTAKTTNASLSASGGSNVGTFFVSGSYSNQDGTLMRTNFERFSIQANTKLNLSDFISMGLSLNPTRSNITLPNAAGKGSILHRAAMSTPYVFNPMSGVTNSGVPPIDVGYFATPTFGLAIPKLLWLEDNQQTNQLIGSGNIKVDILPELKYQIRGGLIYGTRDRNTFTSSLISSINNDLPSGTYSEGQYENYVIDQTITLDKQLNEDNQLLVMIGQSADLSKSFNTSLNGSNFPNDLVKTINVAKDISGSSSANEWSQLSFLGRVNYNYKDRYLLNLNIRRDGSSRFGNKKRWGTFPSISGAWRIENEDFFQSDLFNMLKLRASYGVSGNNQIGDYSHIATLGITHQAFGRGEELSSGYYPTNLGNDRLTWETLKSFNIGVDIGLLDDRISFIMDAYQNVTTSLLMNVRLPAHTGFSSQIVNIGKVLNHGLEFQVNTHNISSTDFNWSTEFNLALNENEVKALGPRNAPILVNRWGGNASYTVVGKPIGSYYLLKEIGVWSSQDEIENNAHWKGARPGDPRIEDINGDGTVNNDDRTFMGRPTPLYQIGLRNRLSYKNFDFSFFFNSSGGNNILGVVMMRAGGSKGQSHTSHLGYWRNFDDPNSNLPEPNDNLTGASSLWTSRGLYDASYIRLKDVSLGYTVPGSLVGKMNIINKIRLSIIGHNVWLSDNAPYVFNVEGKTDSEGSPLVGGGYNYNSYPLPKEILLSINIAF